MKKLAEELLNIADYLERLEKKAGIFAIGDVIVCLNPVEGIVKGKLYRINKFTQPNYISIEDLQGTDIGCFRADRFCKYNYEI